MEEINNYSLLYKLAMRLFNLKVEDARLMLAVKLTKLLGAIVYIFIGFMLLLCCLGFIAVSAASLLCEVMPAPWAYLIIAGLYMLILCIIVAAKKQIIINPIARFISKLIVESPKPRN